MAHTNASHSSVVRSSNIIQAIQTPGGLYLRNGCFTNSSYCVTTSLQLACKDAPEYPTDASNF
eukprot:9682443-Ditylum_brightwellii.AAC.1